MNEPGPFEFRHPTRRVIHGWGALGRLPGIAKSHGARRAAVVADACFRGTPMLDRLSAALGDGFDRPAVVHFVPPREPDTESVEECHRTLARADPDLVVAIGGGSTMDAAKVARIMLANPGAAADLAGFDRPLRAHPSLAVGVPTTAGTGSEVSEMAVVSQAGSDVKLRYRSAAMPFDVALLDPELTVSMPRGVTAQTGFDAFTHALESYVSRGANLMTEPLSFAALVHLARWLPVACDEPANREARSWCLIASMQAAIAFNSTQLGLCHAIAAPLGALHHVVHGLANAIALPAVVAFNEPALGAKGAAIAGALGAPTAREGVARLRERVGLDRGLDSFAPSAAQRDAIAQAAVKSGNLAFNPRPASVDDVRRVLEAMRVPTAGGEVPIA